MKIARQLTAFVITVYTSVAGVQWYQFSTTQTTYQSLTGGTLHTSGNITAFSVQNVPIGFNFWWHGSIVTTCNIHLNGYIWFGTGDYQSSEPLGDLRWSSSVPGVVAPLGYSLRGTPQMELRSQLIGSAPNRVFIVEWKHVSQSGWGYWGVSDYTFQVRLYESPKGRIEFWYGPMQHSYGITADVGIGRRMNDPEVLRVVVSLFGTATTWQEPSLSTAWSNGAGLSATQEPPEGLVYRWEPSSSDAAVGLVVPDPPITTATITVQAAIQNRGAEPITTLTLHWWFNGVTQSSVQWSGNLSFDEIQVVTLGSVQLQAAEESTIDAFLDFPADIDTTDNRDTVLRIAPALGGVYTIGGTNGTFSTFTEALSFLEVAGVYQPVTFQVRSGTYRERLQMLQDVPGASLTNTITFEAEQLPTTGTIPAVTSLSVWLEHPAVPTTAQQNALLRIWSRWVTFRGIGFRTTASTLMCRAVEVEDVQYITFDRCAFVGPTITAGTFSSSEQQALLDLGYCDRYVVKHCLFSGGAWAISAGGEERDDDLRIENVKMRNQYRGAILLHDDNDDFWGCRIERAVIYEPAWSSPRYTAIAVYTDDVGNAAFLNNFIVLRQDNASRGFYLGDDVEGEIVNNIVVGGQYGLRTSWTYGQLLIAHNVFWPTFPDGVACRLYEGGYIDVKNNIFVNTGGGAAIDFDDVYNLTSQHNGLYATGSVLGVIDKVPYRSLSELQLQGIEQNSVNANPYFVGMPTTLEQQQWVKPRNRLYVDAGTTVANVTVDRNGVPWSSPPDLGAFEISSATTGVDIAVVQIQKPAPPVTAGNYSLSVQLLNNGSVTIQTVQLQWWINGSTQATVQWNGNLQPGATTTATLGTLSVTTGSMLVVVQATNPNNTTDVLTQNNTSSTEVIAALSGEYIVGTSNTADFLRIEDALAALYEGGISAPVTFHVLPVTTVASLRLNGPIPGSSTHNTVVIRSSTGDPEDVVFIGNTPALALRKVANLRFEGITFQKNNTDAPVVVGIDTLRNLRFVNCRFIAPTTGWEDLLDLNVLVNSSFFGCVFYGGSGDGIDVRGGDNVLVDSCVFVDNSGYGMVAYNVQNFRITRSRFEQFVTGWGQRHLYLYNCPKARVEQSWFRLRGQISTSRRPVRIYYCDSVAIHNSFFFADSIPSGELLQIWNSPGFDLAFSTFIVAGGSRGGTAVREISSAGGKIRNTLFTVARGQAFWYSNIPSVSDYNLFFVRNGVLGRRGTAVDTTLAQWQNNTSRDQNSKWGEVQFLQRGQPFVRDPLIDQAGVSIGGITEDIQGDTRQDPPDIGADEFELLAYDVGAVEVMGPPKPFAEGTYNIKVAVYNYAALTVSSLQLHWQRNGVTQPTISWSGTLPPGDTVHIALGSIPLLTTTAVHIVTWTAEPNGQNDLDRNNDTASASYQAALAGSYVLGTSATADFRSWAHLATFLSTVGVADSVVIEVEDGVYRESVTIDSIPGAEADKPVIIRAQSGTTHSVVLATTATFVLRIRGADHLVLEDLRLQLDPLNNASRIVILRGEITSVQLRRVRLQGRHSPIPVWAGIEFGGVGRVQGLLLQRVEVDSTQRGILLRGSGGHDVTIDRCIVQNATGVYGMDIRGSTIVLTRNRVQGSMLPDVGIRAQVSSALEVRENVVFASGRGLMISELAGNPSFDIVNNVVIVRGGNNIGVERVGISYQGSGGNLLHNTVRMLNGEMLTSCLRINGANNVIQNNLFSNEAGGYGIVLQGNQSVLDYNAWYTRGPFFGATNYQLYSFAQWQASGKDVNSILTDPQFPDTQSFRPTNGRIDGVGRFLSSVPTDIDGEQRRQSNPSAGADEFRVWQVALIAPPDGAVHQPLTTTLTWSSLAGASTYEVQVATNAQFLGNLVTSAIVTTTSYTVANLQEAYSYWWRVRAWGSNSTVGSWSEEWRFRTIGPMLSITPTTAQLQVRVGDSTTLSVTVANVGQGGQNLEVSLQPLASWISVSPTSVSISAGSATTVTVHLNTSGSLWHGTYHSGIRATSNDPGRQQDTVTIALQVLPKPIDAGIDSLVSPSEPWTDGTHPVIARLRNYGTTTLATVQIHWQINSVTQATYSWNGHLPPGETELVTLATHTFAITDEYQFTIWTQQPNGQTDQFALNDTLTSSPLKPKFAGRYRIGSSTTAVFATPVEAMTLLRQRGMLDTVWLEIEPGTYTGQIDISAIAGLSEQRPLFIQSTTGDSTDVVLTHGATTAMTNYVIRLQSVTSVTIRSLTIVATGATYGRALFLDDDVHRFVLSRCVVQGQYGKSGNSHWLVEVSPNGEKQHLRFEGNRFRFGSVGIWAYGGGRTSEVDIRQNWIEEQTQKGIVLRNVRNCRIENNVIRSTAATVWEGIDLYVVTIAGDTAVRIQGNRILYPNVGIRVAYLRSPYGDTALIANNAVVRARVYGIDLGRIINLKFVHNTVSLRGSSSYSAALRVYGSNNVYIYNNLFAAFAQGVAVDYRAPLTNINSDYNGFFSDGALIRSGSVVYPSLYWWQYATGKEMHSVEAPPYFESDTSFIPRQRLFNGAAAVAWRTTRDIFGTLRSLTDPDIGAVEFAPPSRDIAVVAMPLYQRPVLPGTTTASVVVQNQGGATVTSLKLRWKLAGTLQPLVAWNGTLAPGQTVEVPLGAITLVDRTTQEVEVWVHQVNGQTDQNQANDTLRRTVAPGLAGIYTVGPGAPPPDFAGIAQAVQALDTYGVADSVIFQIRSGTYTESVTIAPIRGASSTATVTFMSETEDSTDVVWKPSNSSFLVLIGASHLVFRDLTLRGNSSLLVRLLGNVRNLRFQRVRFVGERNGGFLWLAQGGVRDTAIQITQCVFVATQNYVTGIRVKPSIGTTHIAIDSTVVENCYTGMSIANARLALQQCRIAQSRTYGVLLDNVAAGSEVRRNWITVSAGRAIALQNVQGQSADRCVLANNMLVGGINIWGTQQFVDIVFNSVVASSTPLQVSSSPQSMRILNNIFMSSTGGLTFDISSLGANSTFDYNAFYTTGQNLGRIAGQYYNSLSHLQNATQTNQNSVFANPLFVSATDLHSRQAQFDSAATPLSFVTLDWDGEARDPNYPDIGADELEVRNNDIGIIALLQPQTACGLTSGTIVKVAIQNYGFNQITTAQIGLWIQSTSTTWSMTTTATNIALAPGDTIHFQFPSGFDFSEPSRYHFRIWTNLAGDPDRSNDTLETVVYHIPVIAQFPYVEGFEDWEGGWLPEGNAEWEWGEPGGALIAAAGQGSKAYVTNLNGGVSQYGYQILMSPCIDFSNLTYDPVLQFQHIWTPNSEHWVDISTDGGSTWTRVTPIWSGNSNGWKQTQHRLVGYAGSTNARLRIVMRRSSNWYGTEGVGVDQVRLSELPAYDLAVTAIEAPSTSCRLSTSESIVVRLTNRGGEVATTCTIGWHVTGATVTSGSQTVTGFAIQTDQTTTITVAAGLDLSSIAHYTLKVWVDFANDARPENDTLEVSVQHLPVYVPATIASMTPANGSSNLSLPITFTWEPAANATHYDLYIWEATTNTRPAQPVRSNLTAIQTRYGNLEYGKSYRWQVVAKYVCLDSTVETDGPIYTFAVRHLPDLRVASISVPPASVVAGSSLPLSWQVQNIGQGATLSQSWYEHVYLSADTSFETTGDNLYLGSVPNLGFLLPGESYVRNRSFTAPVVAGTFSVFVRIQPRTLQEARTDNNITRSVGTVQITLPPRPDLVISQVAGVPQTVFGNDTLTILYTVRNEGNQFVPPQNIWTRITLLAVDNSETFGLGTFTLQLTDTLQVNTTTTGSAQVVIPHTAVGKYFLILDVDATNRVQEEAENNNRWVSTDTLNVLLFPPPDLVPQSVTGATVAYSGTDYGLTWTVKNEGLSQVLESGWVDRVYLCATPVFRRSAVVDSFAVVRSNNPRLQRDSAYTVIRSFPVPNGLSGTYYWYLLTDAANTVFEYYAAAESNNLLRSAAVQFRVPATPDLVVQNLQSSTTAVYRGGNLQLQWEVTNQGNAAANQWMDGVILSRSSVWNPRQHIGVLKTVSHSAALASSATVTVATVVTIPSDLSPGVYYLFVQTDISDRLYEHQGEDNNIGGPVGIVVQVPPTPESDLAVSIVTAPTIASSGTVVHLSYRVENVGSARTGSYYRTDRIELVETGTNAVKQRSRVGVRGRLAPGDSYTRTVSLEIPNGISGSHLLRIQVGDRWDTQSGNNVTTASLLVQLTPPPDLQILSVTAPSVVTAGTQVTVQYQIYNAGTGATRSNWIDRILIGSAPVPAGSGSIGWINQTQPLAAGATRTVTTQVTIPPHLVGHFYLMVSADDNNEVYEHGKEANNVFVTTVTVTPAPRSDLIVSEIVLPTTATLGDMVTVSYRVRNIGTNAAVGLNTDGLFWSADQVFDAAFDPLFGTRSYYLGLQPGHQTPQMTLTAPFYDVEVTLAQHSVVRTNLRAAIQEATVTNNTLISTTAVAVQVRTLTLGVTTQTLLPAGRRIYYKMTVPAGYDILLTVTSNVQSGINEAYVAFERVPKLTDYDFAHQEPYGTDKIVLIPDTRSGDYYLMVRNLTGQDETLTLYARALPFSIFRITPDVMGQGQVTCRVLGAGFTDSVYFQLKDPISQEIVSTALTVRVLSRMEAEIRWLLHAVSTGTYHLVAANGTAATVQLDSALVVEPARPWFLGVRTAQPSSVRGGRSFHVWNHFVNKSNVDIPVVMGNAYLPTAVDRIITSENCLLMNDLSIANTSVTRASYSVFDSSAQRTVQVVPFLVRDLPPNASFSIGYKLVFATEVVQHDGSSYYVSPIRVRGVDDVGYLIHLLATWEVLRRGVMANPQPFLQDDLLRVLALTAPDPKAFRDSMLTAYMYAGWLSEEDTVGYWLLSAVFDTVMVWMDEVASSRTDDGVIPPPDAAVGPCLPCEFQKRQGQQPLFFHSSVIRKACEWLQTFLRWLNYAKCGIAIAECALSIGDVVIGAASGPIGWVVAAYKVITCGYGLYSDCFSDDPSTISEVGTNTIGAVASSAIEVESVRGYTPRVWDPEKRVYRQRLQIKDMKVYAKRLTSPYRNADGKWQFSEKKLVRQSVRGAAKIVGKSFAVALAKNLIVFALNRFCKDYVTPPVVILRSSDPNEIIGPEGYGAERLIARGSQLAYQVKFENVSTATAPAQRVEITVPLDDDFDPRTFRLGQMGFGPYVLQVPENRSTINKVYDLPDSLGFDLMVTAGIDVANHRLFWYLQTIDPATQMPPLASQPELGFLPPNDSTGKGEGFVTFTIEPNRNMPNGDTLVAQATIVFDQNDPLSTNVWTNQLEGEAPWARLLPLPPFLDTTLVELRWNVGQDDSLGVGVQNYDLYVSIDGGPWQEIARAIEDTTYDYVGERGRSYAFFVVARDSVGNTEWQDTAEAFTMILSRPLRVSMTAFLQGPYETTTGTMHTLLNQQHYLPMTDPYLNSVTVSSVTSAVVDWVLVELRRADTPAVVVARKAALMRSDGILLDPDGQTVVKFFNVAEGAYYIVIRHRNHLAIMSTSAVVLSENAIASLEFTSSSSAAYQQFMPPLIQLSVGVYGMVAGDAFADGIINARDRVSVRNASGSVGYDASDVNLDGVVDATDRTIVRNNTFRVTQVP